MYYVVTTLNNKVVECLCHTFSFLKAEKEINKARANGKTVRLLCDYVAEDRPHINRLYTNSMIKP